MATLPNALISALLAIVGLWLLNNIRTGLSSGKLRHSDSTSSVDRANKPLTYWSVLAIQLAIAAVFLFYALNIFLRLYSSPAS